MRGDIRLSEMKSTYFPPSMQPAFMGAHPPVKNGLGSLSDSGTISYFQNYRNENLSKMRMPPYEWGMMTTPYSPRPDIATITKRTNWSRMLYSAKSPVTFLNVGRQEEVNNFYKACQMHRDQYKDHAGRLHPLRYFKNNEFQFQCPSDLTSTYMKFPVNYTKYKHPLVLPITLERSYRSPYLPERALTGKFSPSSDINYKR